MVNVQQVQNGIVKYVETELASKAVGFNKFAMYFILPKIPNKVTKLIDEYRHNPLAEDFFDENGNLKLDEIYNAAKSAISRSGQFTVYNIIFNESDVDKLYNYIKETTI